MQSVFAEPGSTWCLWYLPTRDERQWERQCVCDRHAGIVHLSSSMGRHVTFSELGKQNMLIERVFFFISIIMKRETDKARKQTLSVPGICKWVLIFFSPSFFAPSSSGGAVISVRAVIFWNAEMKMRTSIGMQMLKAALLPVSHWQNQATAWITNVLHSLYL